MSAFTNPPVPTSLRRIVSRVLQQGRRARDQVGWKTRQAAHAVLPHYLRILPHYRHILPEQIRALIPDSARRLVRRALGIEDPYPRVQQLKLRLNELGFVERALADLNLLPDSSVPQERQRANWELAVWHANQKSPAGAASALRLLDGALDEDATPEMLRRQAVLRTECHASLGDMDTARAVVASALTVERHPDLFLAAANLFEDPGERLARVNQALRFHDLACVSLRTDEADPLYDRIVVADALPAAEGPKISVIVPAFNAAEHIATAMEALIAQTWTNFEVLVVDDLSTDATADVVAAFAARDPRIRLIRAEANRGSYVARNIALRQATGTFVTTHDSDDWSHPQKLEIQARHLIKHPQVAANMSEQARATSDFTFHRRGNPGFYIFDNMSSLMFRREPVADRLGFWDSVRFGADSEFIQRIRNSFGDASVASLPAGPLSFQRQSDSSLTGSSVFGYHGFFMGARQAYHHASRRYHQGAKRLYYEFPQARRPFAIPEPMRPEREVAKGERRQFDVVLASDYRMSGNVKARAIEQIEDETRQGRRVGLIQMASYDFDPTLQILPVFRTLEDAGEVEFIVVGEHISCDRLVILHAPVLEEFQRFVPDVEARDVQVLVKELPVYLTSTEALTAWLDTCRRNAQRYFGCPGLWSSKDPKLSALLATRGSSNES